MELRISIFKISVQCHITSSEGSQYLFWFFADDTALEERKICLHDLLYSI